MAPTKPPRVKDLDAMRPNLVQDMKACEARMRALLHNMQARLDQFEKMSVKNREDLQLMMEKIKHQVMGSIDNMKKRLATVEDINTATSRKCEEHSYTILEALKPCHGFHVSLAKWKEREEGRQAATTTNLGNQQDQLLSQHQEYGKFFFNVGNVNAKFVTVVEIGLKGTSETSCPSYQLIIHAK